MIIYDKHIRKSFQIKGFCGGVAWGAIPTFGLAVASTWRGLEVVQLTNEEAAV